jgi:hypothetical protein
MDKRNASGSKLPFNVTWRAGAIALSLAIAFAFTLCADGLANAQTYQVIHTFSGGRDGANPITGVTIDSAGNLYGTAVAGGIGSCVYLQSMGCGTVFKLAHRGSSWLLTPLYGFAGGSEGASPAAEDNGPHGNRNRSRGTLHSGIDFSRSDGFLRQHPPL